MQSMSDTTNSNDQAAQPPSKREKALRATQSIREACRTIYNEAFSDREVPDVLYDLYNTVDVLDKRIDAALPDAAPTQTTGA